jgi:hypothetical protein
MGWCIACERQLGCRQQAPAMQVQVIARHCPLAVAHSRLEYVHGASDAAWRFELAHGAKCISQQLLVLICVNGHTARLQIDDMEMVPIDQDGISCAAKRWMQGLQALIQVDLNHFFAWVFDQSVNKVGIALGHGQMVRVSASGYLTTAQNDL